MLLRAAVVLLLLASGLWAGELQWYRTGLRPAAAPRLYWCEDAPSSVHESVHWVNSQLSNRYGGQCFYIDSGLFVRFPEIPGFHLRQVAPRCRYRGAIFNTYLVQSLRGGGSHAGMTVVGHSSPLYLFDEWAAYTAGSAVAVYGGHSGRADTVEFMLEMAYYCSVVVDHVPADYSHRQELHQFFRWNALRCLAIAERAAQSRRNYNSRQSPWRSWLAAYVRRGQRNG